ncbi:MAG: AzlC family ABC transporter permease [Clostridia bacterium]|nr:AzlC family ABC transporter permease [Clostridia bacterium]
MQNKKTYIYGLKKGLPIALGYLSVSFGFGITSVSLGLSGFEAILISMTNLTSAGQLAGVGVIVGMGSIFEMILTQLVINIRYCLMGLALTQKLDKSFNTINRFLISFGITDEVFAVSASEHGSLTNNYMYGLITLPYIGWSLGTALGAFAGQILPQSFCDALGIAIYSMFVAIILPPSKKHKGILFTVLIASLMSVMFYYVPYINQISQGFSVILCALVSAGLMAYLRPVKEDEND